MPNNTNETTKRRQELNAPKMEIRPSHVPETKSFTQLMVCNLQLIPKTLSRYVFHFFFVGGCWLPTACRQQPKKDVHPFQATVALATWTTK